MKQALGFSALLTGSCVLGCLDLQSTSTTSSGGSSTGSTSTGPIGSVILGDSSGPQEGADLRYIGFKQPN